jgi:hypothetical protein
VLKGNPRTAWNGSGVTLVRVGPAIGSFRIGVSHRRSNGANAANFSARPLERNASATPVRAQTIEKLGSPATADSPFDAATLPPVESIGNGSDIGPFLASGVPADLTRAALRRAWSTDPAIRDFVGLSENDWDFNAPAPGFGSLTTDDVRRLLTQDTAVTAGSDHQRLATER